MGISDSKGIACDFQGHYNVCEDGYMMVGDPTRYLKMPLNSLTVVVGPPITADENHDEEEKQRLWDKGLRQANEIYKKRLHNICCDNCHSHVACALNAMGLEAFGIKKWDMVKLCFLVFFKARFTSVGSMVQQFGPFLFLMFICILLSR
jgi:hypothetical protein